MDLGGANLPLARLDLQGECPIAHVLVGSLPPPKEVRLRHTRRLPARSMRPSARQDIPARRQTVPRQNNSQRGGSILQLKNLVGGLEDDTKAKLLARLHELWKCAGEECA